MLKGKNIILGITGGIAAYKACDIINILTKEGANVDVIMSKNACNFITPLTIETLCKNKVTIDMFDRPDYIDVEHISLAVKADAFLIAPATANIIGKIANGIADDMLSTTAMATKAKIFIAPAMNNQMYENPIVQNNIQKLKDVSLQYEFIEPQTGHLACGYNAVGKLAKPIDIVDCLKNYFEGVE